MQVNRNIILSLSRALAKEQKEIDFPESEDEQACCGYKTTQIFLGTESTFTDV